MNRSERRRVGASKDPTLMIKQSEIDKIKQEATDKAISTAFEIMLAMPVMVLKDKYGFGKKRCERFVSQVIDVWDAVNGDYLTFDDLRETLWEEAGVRLDISEKRKGGKR